VILYEHEAKALLRNHGVAVPDGGLYPDLVREPSVAAPVIVKVQLEEGGRGKRGGVRVVRSPGELVGTIELFRAGTESLPPADTILVEEYVAHRLEIYLALLVDRDTGAPVLLVSPSGGVDIEAQVDGVTTLRPSILAERLPEQLRSEAVVALGGRAQRTELDRLLDGVWECFRDEECLLLEINPCAERDDGSLVALDAKIVIDDNARRGFRPAHRSAAPNAFEAECSAAGVSAAELDGDIGIIVSGAGLAMATLDLVVGLGGRPRCIVDLGYSTLQSSTHLRRVVNAVSELGCRVVLVNAFLQMSDCALLGSAVTSAATDRANPPVVVARFAGNNAADARAIVVSAGGHVASGIDEACHIAVGLTTGRRT
jgi:succinyl-CoA synthetase beta subunit